LAGYPEKTGRQRMKKKHCETCPYFKRKYEEYDRKTGASGGIGFFSQGGFQIIFDSINARKKGVELIEECSTCRTNEGKHNEKGKQQND
jgi:hypothetical protein